MAFNGNSKCWMYPMIEIMSAPDETKPWLIENQAKNLMSFAYHLNSPGANIHLGLTLYAKICCIGIACCQTLWIMKMHQTLVCQTREGGLLTILKPLGIYSPYDWLWTCCCDWRNIHVYILLLKCVLDVNVKVCQKAMFCDNSTTHQ